MVRGPRTAMKSGPRSPQLEGALAQRRGPNAAKKKKIHLQVHHLFQKQKAGSLNELNVLGGD